MNTWPAFSNHLLRSQFPDRCGQDIEGFFLLPALPRVPLVQPGTESRWYEVQLSWPQLPHRENVAHWERNAMKSGATALAQCPAHRARTPCKRGRLLPCSPRPGEWLRDLTTACRDLPTELIRNSVEKEGLLRGQWTLILTLTGMMLAQEKRPANHRPPGSPQITRWRNNCEDEQFFLPPKA